MTKIQLAKITATKLLGRKGLVLKKWLPEIMMFAGAVGVAVAAVDIYKGHLKAEEIIEEAREDFEVIRQAREKASEKKYPPIEHKKDIAKVYVKSGKSFVKLYGRGVTMGLVSLGVIFGGSRILRSRNMAIAAAYTVLESGYNAYRGRVVEEYGEDKDFEFSSGLRKVSTNIETVDAKGKKKMVEQTVEIVDPMVPSMYGRWFDETSREWTKTPEFNLAYLTRTQSYVNDLLKARGHVFLNEVYDRLGFERSGAGAVVGWVVGSKSGDSVIDFGIFDKRNSRFLDGIERSCFLDFNVDGIIYNII